MNIFCTHRDPTIAARYLDDKRVNKMIIESAQLLSAAVRYYGADVGYKTTHLNHPSGVWTRASNHHFHWLVLHAKALCRTYTNTYGKVHATAEVIFEVASFEHLLPDNGWDDWPNCTDDKTTDTDIIQLYRNYMNRKWDGDSFTVTWKKRNMPYWRVVK